MAKRAIVKLAALGCLLVLLLCAQSGQAFREQQCRVLHPRAGTDGCIKCCAQFGMNQKPCPVFGNCVCTSEAQYSNPKSVQAIASYQGARSGQ